MLPRAEFQFSRSESCNRKSKATAPLLVLLTLSTFEASYQWGLTRWKLISLFSPSHMICGIVNLSAHAQNKSTYFVNDQLRTLRSLEHTHESTFFQLNSCLTNSCDDACKAIRVWAGCQSSSGRPFACSPLSANGPARAWHIQCSVSNDSVRDSLSGFTRQTAVWWKLNAVSDT